MSNYTISVKPKLSTLKALFARFTKDMKAIENINKELATVLDAWVLRNFKSEGKSVGGWDRLKAGGRRLPGGGFDVGARVLQDTGRLRGSFVSFWDQKQAGIGSDLDYSEYHEKGMGHLPVRRMLPEAQDVVGSVKKIVEAHRDKHGKRLIT